MKIKITKGSLQVEWDEWGEPIIQLSLEGDKELLRFERKELIDKIVEYLEKIQPDFEIEEQK